MVPKNTKNGAEINSAPFYRSWKIFSLFYRPDHQHHGPAHLVGHAGQGQHLGRRLGLLNVVEGEAGAAEARQDLSQGVVVFEDGPAEEDSLTGTGVEVVINGPRRGDAVFVKKPLLPDTGGENRVLDVKKECASGLQSAINLLKNRAQVGHIVEDEVGDHQVEYGCWVVVFLQIADTVGDARVRIARLCLPNHPLALVDSQHRGRAVVGGIFAVPAVAAAQIQHDLARERWDERLKLMPFPGGGKPLPAPGHLGVGGEKIVGVVEIFHRVRPQIRINIRILHPYQAYRSFLECGPCLPL